MNADFFRSENINLPTVCKVILTSSYIDVNSQSLNRPGPGCTNRLKSAAHVPTLVTVQITHRQDSYEQHQRASAKVIRNTLYRLKIIQFPLCVCLRVD
jgi:hypothetical protein